MRKLQMPHPWDSVKIVFDSDIFANSLTSSRRSVSWGKKFKKIAARGSFSRTVFCAAPQLTERLEEATFFYAYS